MDHRGVRPHGHQRHTPVFRDTSEVLSEYFLQGQTAPAAAGRAERMALSLARLPEGRHIGRGGEPAQSGQDCRGGLPCPVDRHHLFGKNDRL